MAATLGEQHAASDPVTPRGHRSGRCRGPAERGGWPRTGEDGGRTANPVGATHQEAALTTRPDSLDARPAGGRLPGDAPPGRTRRLPARLLALVAVAGAVSLLVFARHAVDQGGLRGSWVDVAVYREAVLAWSSGQPLYDLVYTTSRLPFTYPPFAILPLSWLGLVDPPTAARGTALANIAALLAVCHVSLGAALRGPRSPWPAPSARELAALTLGVAGVAAWLEPVRLTVGYGQVNLVLALLVLVDTLVVPARWRGVLTGIAASVKLVPAIFLLFFLVTGQRRAAVRTVVTAAVATLFAGAVLPGSSWHFWTTTVWTNTTGKTWFAANQSVSGVGERLLHHAAAVGPATVVATVLVVAVGALAIAGCWRAGERLTAVSGCGVVGLLASPISWSHHWVWVVPLVLGLALEVRSRGARAFAWALLAVVAVGAHWFLPQWNDAELGWTWWMNGVGNLYGYLGAAALVVLAVQRRAGQAPLWRRAGRAPLGRRAGQVPL